MDLNTKLLIVAALLPAVILCVYVYKKDKVEKEPLGFLLQLFLLGALSCGPAVILEEKIIYFIDLIFGKLSKNGCNFYLGIDDFYFYNLAYYFIGVALVEEGLKWLIFKFFVFKDKNFNSLFDGLVYAIFISLGFAALENVLYVTQYGWMNALTRGVLSVPGHMFFSVMMGYYYSRWQILKEAREVEVTLRNEGTIVSDKPYFTYKGCAVMSLLIPVLIHGTYNFCLTADNIIFTVIFMIFIGFLYGFSFYTIKKVSASDGYNETYVNKLLSKKYLTK